MFVPEVFCAGWLGYETVTALIGLELDFLGRAAAGFPLGVIYQSLFAFVLQLYFPWGFKFGLIILALTASLAGILHFVNRALHRQAIINIKCLDLVFIVVWCMFSVWRMHRMYFIYDGYSGGSCFSDFTFHLQQISSMAYGFNKHREHLFTLKTPFMAGSNMAYPMLPNFHVAFLISSTKCPVIWAMRITAYGAYISTIFLIYNLAKATTKSSAAALLALPLWTFAAGIGITVLNTKEFNEAGISGSLIHQYTKNVRAFWFQTITHVYHPQRCATFGVPLCILTILCMWYGFNSSRLRYFAMAAIAVAILPQTNMHGYASMAIFCGSLSVISLFKMPLMDVVVYFGFFAIATNIVAIPLCIPFFSRVGSNSSDFLNYHPLWKDSMFVGNHFNFFTLWWRALGGIGFIGIFAWFVSTTKNQSLFYIASLMVALISSMIMFQPWELDNTKLLHMGWLPLAVGFIGQYYVVIWKHSKHIMRGILVLCLFGSLATGIYHNFTYETDLGDVYSSRNREIGHWMSENTAVDAIILNSEFYNPLTSIGGRQAFMGYAGWVSSHGLNNDTRTSLDNSLRYASSSIELLKNGIAYIGIDGNIKSQIESYRKKHFLEEVFASKRMSIFKVMPSADSENKTKRKTRKQRRPS